MDATVPMANPAATPAMPRQGWVRRAWCGAISSPSSSMAAVKTMSTQMTRNSVREAKRVASRVPT